MRVQENSIWNALAMVKGSHTERTTPSKKRHGVQEVNKQCILSF